MWGSKRKQHDKQVLKESLHYQPDRTIYGDAAFPSDAVLEPTKCFEPVGVPVGISQQSGRTIYHPHRTPLITIGKTGSGKSTNAIQNALLDPSLGNYSIIVLDTTGEHTTVCADYRSQFGPVEIVNPCGIFAEELARWDMAKWNPIGKHFLDPHSRLFGSRAAAVATPIFPRVEGHNRYFYDSPRNLLKTVIMVQAKYGRPQDCNLPYIIREIINGPGGIWEYAEHVIPRIDDPYLISELRRFVGSKDVKSIIEFMETAVTEMSFLNDAWVADCLSGEDSISFASAKKIIKTIFVMLPLEVLAGGLGKLLKLVLSCIIAELMREDGKGDKTVIVIADELFALLQGQVDSGFDVAWSASRKYNFILWAAIHDLGQLKDLFPETYTTFLGNAGVQQWLSATGIEESEHLSKVLGKTEVHAHAKTVNWSPAYNWENPAREDLRRLGITENHSQHARDLMLPQEIRQNLGPREQILILDGIPPIKSNRKPYYEDPKKLRRAQPNPFFRGEE